MILQRCARWRYLAASRFWRCCDGPRAASPASGPALCSLIEATSAFPAIASTIALANITALFFVEARLPQLPTIGHASAALGAIATAVALSHLAAFLLMHAGAT